MRSSGARLAIGAACAALVLCIACPPFPAGECDGEEDCPSDTVCDQELRLCVSTEPGGGGDGDVMPIWVSKVYAPHHSGNNVFAGDRGLQLEVKLEKDDDRPLELLAIELLLDRGDAAFTWELKRPLPRTLSGSGLKIVWVYAALAPDLAPGDLVVDAHAYVYDPEADQAERIGPAREPLVLHVGARPVPGDQDGQDPDGDGLSNEVEEALDLLSDDPDSDADGVDDGDELSRMGVPVDSDGDGTPDALDEDSDDGGEPDLLEAHRGGDLADPGDDVQFSPLVVTTTVDEAIDAPEIRDPGQAGDFLSLREALLIANNRPGPDHITFSADLGSQPVVVGPDPQQGWSVLPHITDADTFLDGPGTTIQWEPEGEPSGVLLSTNAPRFTLRGVKLQLHAEVGTTSYGVASFLEVEGADEPLLSQVQIAGVGASSEVAMTGADIFTARSAFVHRCDFGIDAGAPLHRGLNMQQCRSPRVLRSTFICRGGDDNSALLHSSGQLGRIAENTVVGGAHGIKVENAPGASVTENTVLGPGSIGLYFHYSNDILAADNLISERENAGILAKLSARARLQRNLISAIPGYAIFVEPEGGGVELTGPTIASYTDGDLELSGGCECEAGSLIEVFVDPSNDASEFVGEAVVADGGGWSLPLAASLTAEHHFTATYTAPDGTTSSLSAPEPQLP